MEKWKDMIEQFWAILPCGIWAAVGYLAHVLQTGWPGWKLWLSQLVTALIAGPTVGMLLKGTDLNEYVIYGICSCVGMSGGKVVEDLATWSRRRAEKIITGETDDKDGD